MPYTLSHAAAVLPFSKLKFVDVPALVIGSFAPDLLYFVLLDFNMKENTHSGWGLLYLTLPIAIITYIYWKKLGYSVSNYIGFRLKNHRSPIWIIVISLCFGIATHIIWDLFTHGSADYIVLEFFQPRLTWFGYSFWLYDLMQIVSSILGIIIVGTIGISKFTFEKIYLSRIISILLMSTILYSIYLMLQPHSSILLLVSVAPITALFLSSNLVYLLKNQFD